MAIREIGASITADASQFKKEMSAVNSNLAGLQSEMKAVTAEFAENASGTEALSAKQKILEQQEQQQAEKVRALTQAYAEQAAATGENSVEADKLRKQLNNARADYAKAATAVKQNASALKDAEKEERRHTTAAKAGAAALTALKKGGEAAASGVKLAGAALSATAQASAKLVAGAAAAGTALAALGVSGLKTLTSYAVEAAQAVDADGNLINERFSTLAENLTGLDAGASAAKAALGGLLLPVLENLSGEGAALLQGFAADLEACGGSTEKMGQVVSKYLKEAVQLIRKELPGMVSLGSDLIQALLEGLGDAGPEILSAAGEILDMLLDGLEQNADSLGDGASQLIMALLGFILDASPQLLTAGITILTNLITGITNNLPTLIPAAVQAVQQLLQALVQNAPQLLVAGLTLILTLVEGFVDNIPELIAQIPTLIREFIAGFDGSLDSLKNIGSRIVNKILDGLKAAWSAVTDWISGAVDDIGNFLGIGGGGSGHAGGLNYVPYDNYPAILHRGERVLTAAENASGAYGRGGGTVVNNTFNVKSMTRAEMDYWIRRTDEDLGRAV